MKKNAKLAALAILVLAAVAALSVGITLAVLKYECFADETETVPLNGSEIALILRVQ